jgi:WD40 repeat protein
MAIAVTCSCGRRFRAKDEHLGKYARCPGCGQRITIAGERLPNHDVFISYSSKDKQTADAACAALEAERVRCWIAPRDIRPGMDWGGAIIDAIADSRVLVLLFTEHSNQSPQVLREVERAVSKGLVIVPMRLDDAPPSKGMEYFISASHWMDALSGDLEAHLKVLVGQVKSLLAAGDAREMAPTWLATTGVTPAPTSAAGVPRLRRLPAILWALAALVIIVVVPIVGFLMLRGARAPSDSSRASDRYATAASGPTTSAATEKGFTGGVPSAGIAEASAGRVTTPTTKAVKAVGLESPTGRDAAVSTGPTTATAVLGTDAAAPLTKPTTTAPADSQPPNTRPLAGADAAAAAATPIAAPLQAGSLRPLQAQALPETLIPNLRGGAPLTNMALVAAPAMRPGLSSWTIETRHTRGPILAAEYSPNTGRYLATAGTDGAVRIWSAADHSLLRVLLGHDGSVLCLKWSADGRRLVTGGTDGRVQVWSVEDGRSLGSLNGKDGAVNAVGWSLDAKQVLLGTETGVVRALNVAGHQGERHVNFDRPVNSLACSPNGMIAVGIYQQGPSIIKLLDGRTFGPVGEFVQDWGVTSLHWSPDGKRLASGDGKGIARIWGVATMALERSIAGETTAALRKVEWAPDGRRMALGYPGEIYILEPEQQKPRRLGSGRAWHPTWSPDGKTLACARPDGAIDFWSTANWTPSARPAEGVGQVGMDSWSADGGLWAIAIGSVPDHSQVRVIDVRAGRLLRQFAWPNFSTPFSLSADGRWLSSYQGEARVGEIDLRTTLQESPLNVKPSLSGRAALARAPTGSLLAAVHSDSVVRIWDVNTGAIRATLSGVPPVEIGFPLVWSPDGKMLAVSHVRGEISIWDEAGGRVGTITHNDRYESAYYMLWSPNGRFLASSGESSGGAQTRVWEVKSGRQLAKIDSAGRLQDWSPNSRFLLLGHETALFIFAAQGGSLERPIELPPVNFGGAGYTRSRWLQPNLIAMASSDGGIRLYDPVTACPTGTVLTSLLPSGTAALDVDGHIGPDGIGDQHLVDHFVYVVQTTKATQETLTPDEFARRFNWHNAPQHVQLLSPAVGTGSKSTNARTPQKRRP